ncbi:hypothetical protein KC357_g255 [Hortaea werneckii]|nr:hypothetical protein KC357_g255 [Hortaea werneckii]
MLSSQNALHAPMWSFHLWIQKISMLPIVVLKQSGCPLYVRTSGHLRVLGYMRVQALCWARLDQLLTCPFHNIVSNTMKCSFRRR